MTYLGWKRLYNIVNGISEWTEKLITAVVIVLAVPVGIAASPFIGLWYGGKCLYNHFHKKREAVKEVKPHITPKPNTGSFLFREDRELKLRMDKVAYVETVHNERLHEFFEKDKEWLRQWQEWYGIDIVHIDNATFQDGMVYPQDFTAFHHGFVWQMPVSSSDGVNTDDKMGHIAYYFELDPCKDKPLREQMKDIVGYIYGYMEEYLFL